MSSNISTVLVTGAAGLIGSEVTHLLLDRGIYVVTLDNFSIGSWRDEEKAVAWENVDVSKEEIVHILNKHNPDAVIHCAAHPGGRSLMEPSEDVRVNALGSMHIFEWCCRTKAQIVYLSSSVVYGEQPNYPIPENASLQPGTIYGICKVACENFLKVLGNGYKLNYTILRLFSTYGAGHRPSLYQGIVNVMLKQLMSGNRVEVKGALNRVRDLIYVADTARAIVDSLFNEDTRGKVLNVGTGTGKTVLEIIELLCDALGRHKDDLEIVEMDPVVGDPFYNVADITKLQEITGFKPDYDLPTGLNLLIQKYMRIG